jgi:hypothetical protein
MLIRTLPQHYQFALGIEPTIMENVTRHPGLSQAWSPDSPVQIVRK